MSQEELAAEAGLSASTIQYVEDDTADRSVQQKTARMIEGALGWEPGSFAAMADGRHPTLRAERAPQHDSEEFRRQVGYMTALLDTTPASGVTLSAESWEMLRAKAVKERRNVNAVLIDALRLHDELLGTGE